MKLFINFLLTFIIFGVGNEYFNEYINIDSMQTLIIASLLMFALNYLFSLLMMISLASILVGIGCFTTIILYFISWVLTPVKLWLLNTYLSGFEIHGFWTYVILTVTLSIFSYTQKTNKTSN